jgi:hypothetical protein
MSDAWFVAAFNTSKCQCDLHDICYLNKIYDIHHCVKTNKPEPDHSLQFWIMIGVMVINVLVIALGK